MQKNFQDCESHDLNGLLNMLVGKHYGNNPASQLDNIIKVKEYEAQNVIKYLNLSKKDSVMDFGSGTGFVAQHIASYVDWIECVDISESFLNYAKKVNANHNNIGFCQIQNGRLKLGKLFTAIYSINVFIHFNLFDCYWNLLECYNCLNNDGRLLFDILNSDHLDIHNKTWQRHAKNYLQDRFSLFKSLHYNNKDTIQKIATQIGFQVESCFDDKDHTFFILKKQQ